jgi:hypothetical protein
LTGELAEEFPRYGPRLSLFWTSEGILKGEGKGGRLGPIDAADLAENGLLLWGREIRDLVAPLSREGLVLAMGADMSERWHRRIRPFHGRDLLEHGRGAELDERTLVKLCLYPARFLFTAQTGRLGRHDEAGEFFAARYGEPLAAPVRLACAVRGRASGPEATAEERESLAGAFRPLYALFFEEISKRYGLEVPRN